MKYNVFEVLSKSDICFQCLSALKLQKSEINLLKVTHLKNEIIKLLKMTYNIITKNELKIRVDSDTFQKSFEFGYARIWF